MREKIFLTYHHYGLFIENLKDIIKFSDQYKSGKYKYIYGIYRGGLPIAVHLSHHLNLPLIKTFEHITKPSEVLIVDDICDTGKTLEEFKGHDTATLYYKDRSTVKPTYYVNTTNKWVIYPWEHENEVPNRPE